MHDDTNPYQPPGEERQASVRARSRARRWITKRRVAVFLIAVPFLLVFPVGYWVFNVAGDWYVNTDLEPDHRGAHLAVLYIGEMMCVVVLAMFPAFLLLWLDRWHPGLTGPLTIIFGVLMIPALVWIFIHVEGYLEFS